MPFICYLKIFFHKTSSEKNIRRNNYCLKKVDDDDDDYYYYYYYYYERNIRKLYFVDLCSATFRVLTIIGKFLISNNIIIYSNNE